jgi:transcriptional pleiotropic regulator of transition state genes
MTRKVDGLGRVVLPAELRAQLSIAAGDLVEISVDERRVVLEKLEQRCVFCGATTELREFSKKLVCASCIDLLTAT